MHKLTKRAALLFLLLAAAPLVAVADPFGLSGIRSGLQQSPNDYVAAVVRFTGEIQCPKEVRVGQCWALAVVVEEIASRPASKSPREIIKIRTAASPGKRLSDSLIVFAVPIPQTDIYHMTLGMVYTRSSHERFKHLVDIAINGTRSI